MALLNEGQITTSLPPLPKRFEHHALFSYADGDTPYVRAVREALPKEVKVFDYKTAPIWGRKLEKALEQKYKHEAPFCVVFISQFYLASPWTETELKIVSRVANEKPGYMLPVVLDGTIVPEIEGIGWLDERLTPEEVAAQLVAKICEPPPKPWWFYVSTEAKVALAVVLLALVLTVYFIRPSRTQIKSVQVTEEAIIAHLANSGPMTKTATIVGQRLRFGDLPIEDKELRLGEPGSATIGRGEHDVELIALELLTECGPDEIRPNKHRVLPLLDQKQVTLEIDIRESDDAPDQSRRRSLTFPAANLTPFVRKLVSGRDTPCFD